MPRPPKPPPKTRPDARVVRRHDSIGRAYFIRTGTGERVKRSSWERDLARRDRERSAAQYERARADAEERLAREGKRRRAPEAPPKAPKRPGKPPRGFRGPRELPAPPAPFPPGVSDLGVPEPYVDEDGGQWDAVPIEGDDET